MGKEVHANDFLQFAVRPHPRDGRQLAATLGDDDLAAVREPAPRRGAVHRGDVPRHLLRRRGQPLPRPRRAPRRGPRSRAPRPRARLAAPRLPQAPAARRLHRGRAGPLRRRAPRPAPLAEQHFLESAALFNALVFDSGREHRVTCGDVFALDGPDIDVDLVYLDPPYVPRADDNCYIKRYHFLEGLSTYWQDAEFHPTSRVRKLAKRHTPFSYRREADQAFAASSSASQRSTIVLSYSSNGYPDLDVLTPPAARAQGRRDGARAGAPLPLRHAPRRGAGAGGRARVPAGRR